MVYVDAMKRQLQRKASRETVAEADLSAARKNLR